MPELHELTLCVTGRFIPLESLEVSLWPEFLAELTFLNGKKQCAANATAVLDCKIRDRDFRSFYHLREDKQKEHGTQSSRAQSVDVAREWRTNEDNSLREELSISWLIVSWKMGVVNFAMDTLDPKILWKKQDIVFDSLICAAKLKVKFKFVLKIVENGTCRQ